MMGPEASGSGFFTQPTYRRLPPCVIFHAGGDQTVIRAVSEDRPHRPKVDHLAGLGLRGGGRSVNHRLPAETKLGHAQLRTGGSGRITLPGTVLPLRPAQAGDDSPGPVWGAAASERLPAGVRQPRSLSERLPAGVRQPRPVRIAAEMDTRTGLPVVGMVGGGQLARMTHQAAISLGQSLRILAVAPDDGAAQVAADVYLGHHTDLDALRAFANGCDVVTFDHEHVPVGHVAALVADGINVAPGPGPLRYVQDKRAMRERLAELGVPIPRWAAGAEAARFAASVGWPLVAKKVRGGYDGRGVWIVDRDDPLPEVELIVEERVPLRRELAALVARSP